MMNEECVSALEEINRVFYSKCVTEFSSTRRKPWEGWERVVQYIRESSEVLDVGCGNGRFVGFLKNKLNHFKYTGLDDSESLLDIAKAEFEIGGEIEFLRGDFLSESGLKMGENKFDVIVMFGVWHHIAGMERRLKAVERLLSLVKSGGLVVFSVWQFADRPRFESVKLNRKEIESLGLNLELDGLERGDYLMNFGGSGSCIRYCHHSDAEELGVLGDWFARRNVSVVDEYVSDGKTGDLNRYFVLKAS